MCHLLYLLFDWISENDEKRVHSFCTRQTLLLWHLTAWKSLETMKIIYENKNSEEYKTKDKRVQELKNDTFFWIIVSPT